MGIFAFPFLLLETLKKIEIICCELWNIMKSLFIKVKMER